MDERETNRLEAFSDGVFAVAITLLVLSIRLPGIDGPASSLPDDAALWHILLNEWPVFVAYVTSFMTIGIMWINHHRLFVHIKRTDTGLFLFNLLLLLVIVFIPVPTALLAAYLVQLSQHAAAMLYCGVCFMMACFFNLLWRYASYHNRLLGRHVDTHTVNAISRQYLFGPLAYLVSFGLAWISAPLSIFFIFVLALFFALPGRSLAALARKDTRKTEPAGQDTALDA